MTDDIELVVAAQAGQRAAFAPLVDRWFDRCWEVAWRILHDRDLAADVAQDTLLVAWRRLDELARPESFGGWVLRIARNRALDRLKRERRMLPTADDGHLEPTVRSHDTAGPEAAVVRDQQRDLVWAAAAALGERDASLLDLHLRHGLEPAELADELGIAPNAAHQAMFRLRQRLGSAIQAWLLWRNADPACDVLRTALAAAGDAEFGAATARRIRRHADSCDMCARERERVVAPAALFSVVPLVAAPAAARARVMALLSDAGVPVPDGGAGAGTADPGATGGGPRGGSGGGQTAVLPAARGGRGFVTSTARHAADHLGLLAVTLAVVLAIGGVVWSSDRAAHVTPVPVATVTQPAPAAAATPVPVAPAPPQPTVAPEEPEPRPIEPVPTDRPAPAPTRTPAPTEPITPPPTIDRFLARWVAWCAPPPRHDTADVPSAPSRYELTWSVTNADTAQLTDAAGVAVEVPTSGTTARCSNDPAAFTLTATGAGGATAERVVGQAPAPPQ